MSPYLFVICAHGLSELITKSEQRKFFKGVSIASGYPSISHLFFADDNLIFCRAKLNDCTHLRRCLESYSNASVQMINFDKLALSFSPNTYVRDWELYVIYLRFLLLLGMRFILAYPLF